MTIKDFFDIVSRLRGCDTWEQVYLALGFIPSADVACLSRVFQCDCTYDAVAHELFNYSSNVSLWVE